MNEKVKRILIEIRKCLIENFGNKIKQVILCTPCAQEDSNKNSNIDVVIIMNDDVNCVEIEEFLNNLLFEAS